LQKCWGEVEVEVEIKVKVQRVVLLGECFWFLAHTFKRFHQRCRVDERLYEAERKTFPRQRKAFKMINIAKHV